MMATEATLENIATTSIVTDHELNTTETTTQDVPSEQIIVNGSDDKEEIKHDTDLLEPNNVNSAEVSVSGGSDTEASKAETTKAQSDEKGHVRTTSTVKRLTSFKPVSVNKTFLAAKGATTTALSKLGDKGSVTSAAVTAGPTSSGLAARPRLVAKSGSGLRDSTPKNAATANGGKAGAPDASAVWNKNRPTPAPEPKRFTDEELKQRYGIHLATRLQSDDPGKQQQANWADIDDDDDDWAPEAIEWNDGTKITLPQADEIPLPVPEPIPAPAPAVILKEKPAEIVKPKSPAPSQASGSPTVKTTAFGGRAGLVLKGATEKPTLVAKPPGPPTPVKSPWAPLPPVEKVAPVVIDIPQQQQPPQNRSSQKDPHGFQGMPPPAKEIAADDFSRSSWRENPNTKRELFNSTSGNYEPVNDGRRGSIRNDARPHQPAVLQRPTNQDGPAEPSAAFQTHRAGGPDGQLGRRRTSSNVSGGSGNLARRMSRGDMLPPQELLSARRGSLAAVSDEPTSPRNFSPSGQRQNSKGYPPWQSRAGASPVASQNSPQSAHGQPVPPSSAGGDGLKQQPVYEDPLEVQKKVMQEKRAAAIARRKEQEAAEEAAKRERIALKLASMGPPPEPKKKDAVKEEIVASPAAPTQIQTRENKQVESPKVVLAEKSSQSELKLGDSNTEGPSAADPLKEASTDKESTPNDRRPNGVHRIQETVEDPNSQERGPQWQSSASSQDRFKPWAAPSSQQSSSRNVWGPPSNDRTLGNGTFDPELGRLPDMHSAAHPGPIGPPNRGNGQGQQGNDRDQYSARSAPAPIGPPQRRQGSSSQVDPVARAAVTNSAWSTLPQKIAEEDALLVKQQDAQKAQTQQLKEQGHAAEATPAVVQDTWRPVTLHEDGTRSKIRANVTTTHGTATQPRGASDEQESAHRRPLDMSNGQTPFNDAWRASPTVNAPPPARGSRFFPNNRDIRLEEQNILPERPGSPTPPPPTMAGHPAYDGDMARPHVSLPRPPPIVKLPPPTVLAPIAPPKPATFAAAVSAPVVPPAVPSNTFSASRASQYQDIRKQEPIGGGWQEKINSLVGRKTSPPKSHALAVDSASKNALELSHQHDGATVSLPSPITDGNTNDVGAIDSKPAAEECFEEQEMGSLPNIKVPHQAPEAAWNPARAQPKMLPRKFAITDTVSVPSLTFTQPITNNSTTITIKVPFQEEAKTVSVAVTPRQKSNPRRGGPRGGGNARYSSSSHPRGGRGQDGASGFPSPGPENASVGSTSHSTSRGGRSRSNYGSNWNRHVSTPVHT